MYVLGISCFYHDASACLVQDGKIIAAASEERFSRRKHDASFPFRAVDFCLESAHISMESVQAVCFYEKPLLKIERILQMGKTYADVSTEQLEGQVSNVMRDMVLLKETLQERYQYDRDISYVHHHLSHAASAFFTSPFSEAAILTVDGVGEWATTAQFSATGNRILPLQEIHYPHSLGLFYSTITAYLGFEVNEDEYKVMGLAGYGQPRFYDALKELIYLYPDGSFALNLDYFTFMYDKTCMYSEKLIDLLGPPRLPASSLEQCHADVAASLQKVVEEAGLALATSLWATSGQMENLCMSGGVGLNSLMNQAVKTRAPFKNIWIPPAPGDAGGAVGAALFYYYTFHDFQGTAYSPYSGPEYTDEAIEKLLTSHRACFHRMDDIPTEAAKIIFNNLILAVFQGKMEFGPRALGNRSILANPCNPAMKEWLNKKVKFREDFRPFAPAILEEKKEAYFELDFHSPYMLFITPVKQGGVIPAVTHVDHTARVQTVRKDENPLFYQIIEAFGKLSGVPVVLNTSFNVKGEPIVCSPEDAYQCFMRTNIDYCIMGNFLVGK